MNGRGRRSDQNLPQYVRCGNRIPSPASAHTTAARPASPPTTSRSGSSGSRNSQEWYGLRSPPASSPTPYGVAIGLQTGSGPTISGGKPCWTWPTARASAVRSPTQRAHCVDRYGVAAAVETQEGPLTQVSRQRKVTSRSPSGVCQKACCTPPLSPPNRRPPGPGSGSRQTGRLGSCTLRQTTPNERPYNRFSDSHSRLSGRRLTCPVRTGHSPSSHCCQTCASPPATRRRWTGETNWRDA